MGDAGLRLWNPGAGVGRFKMRGLTLWPAVRRFEIRLSRGEWVRPERGLLRNSISGIVHLVFGRQITSHRWFLKIWSDIDRPANLHAIRHRWGGHPGERDVQCAILIGDVNAECLRISAFTEVAHQYVSRFVRFQKNSFNGLHVKQVVAAI